MLKHILQYAYKCFTIFLGFHLLLGELPLDWSRCRSLLLLLFWWLNECYLFLGRFRAATLSLLFLLGFFLSLFFSLLFFVFFIVVFAFFRDFLLLLFLLFGLGQR